MANVNSINVSKYTGTGYSPIDASSVYGKQRVWLDSYEADNLIANDTISFAVIEKGAVITDIVVKHASLGESVSAKVGTSEDDDMFIIKSNISEAGNFSLVNDGNIAQLNSRMSDDTTIQLKFNINVTGSIKFQIFYTVE